MDLPAAAVVGMISQASRTTISPTSPAILLALVSRPCSATPDSVCPFAAFQYHRRRDPVSRTVRSWTLTSVPAWTPLSRLRTMTNCPISWSAGWHVGTGDAPPPRISAKAVSLFRSICMEASFRLGCGAYAQNHPYTLTRCTVKRYDLRQVKGLADMADNDVQREAVTPPWRRYTKAEEDQRLDVLDARIERRKAILEWDQRERTRIMHRAIRRMRRAEGKE